MSASTRSISLLLIALLGLAGAAQAQVAPYADWRFQLDRARGDAARMQALAQESPAFTRAWFYGHVFDLSIAGISPKEKKRIRARAALFAEVLATAEPPDLRPALLLEVPTEVLRADFDAMEAVLNASLNSDRPVDRVYQALATIKHPLVAHAAFYAQLHRADVANPRLGGRYDAARRLEAARGLAEILALADGDLAPWRALAAFRGDPIVRVDKLTIAEDRACVAMNQIASETPAQGQATILDARRAIGDAGAPALRLAMTGLGPGLIAERRAQHATARGTLSAGSRGGPVWIQRVLKRRAIAAAIAADDPAGARTLIAELERLIEGQRADPREDTVLLAAVELWRTTGDALTAAGKLDAAAVEYGAAQRWATWLRRPERVAETAPTARQAAAQADRAARAGAVALANGHLALRLGREAEAAEAFRASRGLFQEAAQSIQVAAAELALAEALLFAGDLDASLARVDAALPAAQAEPAVAARGLGLRSLIRLRRGELAQAFANANAGLSRLRAAGLAAERTAERVRLHLYATAALDAAGFAEAARARAAFARGVVDTPEAAQVHATLLAESGDLAGARAALAPHQTEAEVAVSIGCLETRAGDHAQAAARLAPLATRPNRDLDQAVRARACLAAAWIGLGRRRQARSVLLPQAQMVAADPAERWALYAAVSMGGGADVDQLRGAAIESWRVARGAGHWRTALDRRPRAYADVGPVVEAGVVDDLARRNPAWAVSLPRTVWWTATRRALRAVAPRPDVDLPGADLRRLRGPLLRAQAQRAVLADPAIEEAARAEAVKRRAIAWREAGRAADALLMKHRRWADYAAPLAVRAESLRPAAGTTRLFVQTGPARSRVWLYRAGAKAPVAADLPGRAALASLRAGVEGHLSGARPVPASGQDPHAKAWVQLADAARTLVPQLTSAKAPAGGRLEVYGEGPLAFFPWQMLVLTPPARSGPAPRFVADAWTVVHRLSLKRAAPSARPSPAWDLRCAAPCPAALEVVAKRLGARGGQLGQGIDLTLTRPLAHLHGVVQADALSIGETRTPYGDIARLGASGLQVAVSGEIDGPRGRFAAAWAHGGAQQIALPVGPGPLVPDATIRDAWSRVIGKAPRPELVFSRTERGGALVAGAPADTSPGEPLLDALSATQRRRARTPIAAGAVPDHHPSRWARWIVVQP